MENSMSFLKKLKIELPYDSTNPLLGVSTTELKTGSWKDICTPMFIAVLVTIAKKQPKYSLTDEWIKKIWYIHTKEYYSA